MDLNSVKLNLRVKITQLESTAGMMINERHLNCRRLGVTGVIKGWVPGHGGDVWFIKHDGSEEVGAYCFTEFEGLEGEITKVNL